MTFQIYRRAPSLLKRIRIAHQYATSTSASLKNQEEADPQIADYPRLPWVSKQRLPARGWWDPQMRRNYGDTYHEQEEILGMWGPDASPVPPKTALRWFSIAVASFLSFGLLTKFALVPNRPAVAREYPFSGLITELGGLEENKAREESDEASD